MCIVTNSCITSTADTSLVFPYFFPFIATYWEHAVRAILHSLQPLQQFFRSRWSCGFWPLPFFLFFQYFTLWREIRTATTVMILMSIMCVMSLYKTYTFLILQNTDQEEIVLILLTCLFSCKIFCLFYNLQVDPTVHPWTWQRSMTTYWQVI